MQNDSMAYMVAERCIDYYYDKIQQENIKRYNRIQQKKEIRQKRRSIVELTGAILILIAACMILLNLEMDVKSKSERVANLQIAIQEVQNKNEDTKKRLIDSADYKWIEQEAMKFGMTYPTQDKVVYYTVPDKDYVIQTEEIPES